MLTWMAIGLYMAFPPLLLAAKFLKKKPSWWALVGVALGYALVGWALILYGYIDQQTEIGELIREGKDEELPPGWDSDGAAGVFALFLGWLVPMANLLFWAAVYGLATALRLALAAKETPDAQTASARIFCTVATVARLALLMLVLVILLGALLGGNHLTAAAGFVFGLFLVRRPSAVARRRWSYFRMFVLFALAFLVGSYMDMKQVQSKGPGGRAVSQVDPAGTAK